jgi:hypothetical protein
LTIDASFVYAQDIGGDGFPEAVFEFRRVFLVNAGPLTADNGKN